MKPSTRAVHTAIAAVLAGALGAATIALSSSSASADTAVPVQKWLTTSNLSSRLAAQPGLAFTTNSATPNITVDDATTYQTMAGFGAAMTDTSAWLISNKLSAANHTQLMNALFSPTNGIGMSWVRVPMGASDFSATAQPYSYDDMPSGQTDPTLSRFSISHDLAYIIPDLKEAAQLNPSLKLMANPWSPPGWMKANGQMSNVNGAGTLLSSSYAPLANYFVKFLQAYAAQGVNIYAITPQNEPGYSGSYPNMNFSEANEASFVANNLGPALNQAGLHPVVLGVDFNTNVMSNFGVPLMNNAAAAQYLAGTAWHCYAGNLGAMGSMHNSFPTKDIYETECSSGIAPQSTAETFIQSTRNWAKAATMWNIAEDTNNGPVIPGGCGACTPAVTINQSTGAITYNLDYYVIGQFSKFVVPGAQRIASNTSGSLDDVAFRNPDGSEALVVTNTSASQQTFTTSWHGQSFTDNLPAGAVATYTWTPGVTVPTTAPASTPPASSPASSTTTIVGQGSGKCLDDRGNPANGTQQYIWTCAAGNANQLYTYTAASQLQIAGQCLGAAGNGTSNGTQVITYTCNGTPSQAWTFNSNGTITNNLSGLCLDVTGNGTANATPVELWSCNGGNNQKWSRR
jgi:glucosylceramidase